MPDCATWICSVDRALEILLNIAKNKAIHAKWKDQPLELIKALPNSSKGDLGEAFIAEYSSELGFTVAERHGRLGDFDVDINGHTFEVKMATEDVSGCFQFNHIRYDYAYDWLLCLGISPADIWFDIFSKADVATGNAGSMVTMGRGQNSSFKLTKRKTSLQPISKFKGRILALTGQHPTSVKKNPKSKSRTAR